jgi:hypothetical protein
MGTSGSTAITYNPDRHHRRSIRLRGYDYAQEGAYCITLCTQGRVHLFGAVRDGHMILSDAGEVVEREWLRNYYEHIICNENGLNRIRRYIEANPARWRNGRP